MRPLGSIERMLNLNHESQQSANGTQDHGNGLAPSAPILNEDGDPIWKVLVFDDLGRDVISSVLRVNDLRTWGVTMHMYVPKAERGSWMPIFEWRKSLTNSGI
jgi:hypothetical protein